MQNVHFYDTAEPYQKLKSQRVIEEVQPTPEFPYVSCNLKHSVGAHSGNLTRCIQTKPFAIPQYKHQLVFREHLSRLGVEVELGSAAVAIEQDQDCVTVYISKTSNGVEVKEQARVAYVIGADGGRSEYFIVIYSCSNCSMLCVS